MTKEAAKAGKFDALVVEALNHPMFAAPLNTIELEQT
ncbi:hypothetical protein CHELA40_11998 [Chelatococcus asaccharovorans]|nr:hypothetical protein CHELA40_11998 [Chelatococcus asaccharovorans]CAH1683649.1 hypothetical protein CHELA17_63605 [Chelatococcus asaccharovorans]